MDDISVDRPRKRKSRFDVPPEGVDIQQMTSVVPNSVTSFDADLFLSSILPSTLPSEPTLAPQFITFTEPFFTERLHKAMEKNLAYIER